jgi:hypothetical protein
MTCLFQGFMWLAGRDEQIGEWSQAGTVGAISCGDLWLALFPKEALPEEGSESWQAMQSDVQVRTAVLFSC